NGRTDTGNLVSGNAHPYPRAANENPAFKFPFRNGLCNRESVIRIVAAFRRVAAEILDCKTQFVKVLHYLFLKLKPYMVTAYCNLSVFHLSPSPLSRSPLAVF